MAVNFKLFSMDTQNQNKTNKPDKEKSNSHDSDGSGTSQDSQGQNWPRYWIMEGTDASNPLSSMNPFLVSKAIQGISPSLKVKRLRNGSLLLECDRQSQARTLQRTSRLGQVPVRVSPHKTMNSCQGIIRCRDIADMAEDEIQLELSSQGVTKVKQFTIKKDGQVRKTGTFLLTFDSTSLPQSINVGYLRTKVDIYVPNPLRCFKCQKFGHGQTSCKGQSVCMKCGKASHGDDPCTGPLHCVNCAGSHASNSKQCPTWRKECAIQKMKTLEKLPYGEAKKRVEAANPPTPTGGTYASAVVRKVSIGVQTNVSYVQIEKSSRAAAQSARSSPGQPSPTQLPRTAGPASSGEKTKGAVAAATSKNAAATAAAPKSSGAASPAKKAKDAESKKVTLNRNGGSRSQKGSNDPIKEGLATYEEESVSVSSNKRGKGKSNNKTKLQS